MVKLEGVLTCGSLSCKTSEAITKAINPTRSAKERPPKKKL